MQVNPVSTPVRAAATRGGHRRTSRIALRAGGAAAAIAAPVAVWALARAAGVDVESVRRSERAVDLPALYVVIVGAVFVVLGWASLALLERFVPRLARPVWAAAGGVVLLVALVHSAVESKLAADQRMVLMVMTAVFAAALMPALLLTSPPRSRRS